MNALAQHNGEDLAAAAITLENRLVNLAQLGDVTGISQTTLRNFIRRHEDFPIVKGGAHGIAYEFDVSEVKVWLLRHAAEAEAEKVAEAERVAQLRFDYFGGDLGTPDPAAKRLSPREESDLMDARFKALKLARMQGELVARGDLEQVLGRAFLSLRDDVLGLADHLGRELSLDRAARNTVEEILEAALRRLADKLADPALYAGDQGNLTHAA